MANKSGVSEQVITLPKGGGAIQGIGETFSPDLHTGTGNFTVPIAVPSGRNGFQPHINLVYSSGNGNDIFGFGWSLSIPNVQRKTSKGIPRYQDDAPNGIDRDLFVLSGAEDLVPIEFASGTIRYQPRTEGLFAHIDHHQTPTDDFWTVQTKDGLRSFYGTSGQIGADQAVLSNPDIPQRIFAWYLTRTEDPFGNQIVYDYELDQTPTGTQIYLTRVRYINTGESSIPPFLVSISFVYTDRPDHFSSCRSGFEIQTRRRCSRIEVFVHDVNPERLVRIYHLDYLDERTDIDNLSDILPLNGVSLLSRVRVVGIDEQSNAEMEQSLPPLEFDYTRFEPQLKHNMPIGPESNLPERSLDHPEYELIDLFGNGLPDVVQMDGAIRYWRNLGNGCCDVPRFMQNAPAGISLGMAGVQLADMNGDARTDLYVNDGLRNGYFTLGFDGKWDVARGFTAYPQSPTIPFDTPNMRLMDLDGDGITDALRTGVNFELFYHDAQQGWVDLQVVAREDISRFPNVDFSDPRVRLADLNGDDLQDIVLIHNGRVEYWPYMGYGRWDERVVMDNSPIFDDARFYPSLGFDPERILLGDVDGDGLTDFVYVGSGHITIWINQSGNAWSDPITIHGTPLISNRDAVRLVDLLGNGTLGILWTYDRGTQFDSTYKYLDLTGGTKPYVLNHINNNMGAVTHVDYAPSTIFYLADQEEPQTRWQTPLPFPVHVVAQVTLEDIFSQSTLTTEYRYHHGYWDGVEREFRGFGMVEQVDSQRFAQPVSEDDVQFTPPVLTKTWFHQGAISLEADGWEEADYSAEYWSGDVDQLDRPDDLRTFLSDRNVSPQAKRDAIRSLRGRILRTELYALDGATHQDRPYTVTEHQFSVREESPPTQGDATRYHIFFPHAVAERTSQWERGTQPMTHFNFISDYDVYGQSRLQVSLAVPFGRDIDTAAANAEPYLGTLTTTTYAQRDDTTHYIVDRVASASTFEIINDGRLRLFDLLARIHDGTAQTDLFAQTFNYYDGDAFVGLSLGNIGDFGALVRTEMLVLNEDILRAAYRDDTNTLEFPPYLRPDGVPNWTGDYPPEFQTSTAGAGFGFADGTDHRSRGYYIQQLRARFDFQVRDMSNIFGLKLSTLDPFGSETIIEYDDFNFMPVKVTDPIKQIVEAVYDYRVMQLRSVTDVNNNVSEFAYTPLGLVKELFTQGDNTRPSTRFEYGLLTFVESPPDQPQPIFVRTIQFEHHDTETDVPLAERDATIETIEYSDGFGRLLQTRIQAEDVLFGDANLGDGTLPGDPDDRIGTTQSIVGRLNSDPGNPNVVVSGWQIYDNKGQVVEKYEPFFDVGWAYDLPTGNKLQQKVTMFYDPRGQVIRTVKPDGSEQRVILGIPVNLDNPDDFTPTPWEIYTYDSNDLAPMSVGSLPDGTQGFLTSRAPSHHHFTPSNIVIDALGRTTMTVERNRLPGQSAIDEFITRFTYDIRGNVLSVTDALDRTAFRYTYDLANMPLRIESIDAGTRCIILNAVGNEIERRDSKGALILQAYDTLQRPFRVWAKDDNKPNSSVGLREVLVYGDDFANGLTRPDAQARNLGGMVFKHYDEAGLVTFERYDFKGNLLEKIRQVIADSQIQSVFPGANDLNPNWNIQAFRVDWQMGTSDNLSNLETALLDQTAYRTSSTYDALNRIKSIQYPQDVARERKVLRPQYNRGGTLEHVVVFPDINSTDGDVYVEHIAYNARGQRTFIAHGNGILTRYAYDPLRFRLSRLRTESYLRAGEVIFQPVGRVHQDFGYDYDLIGNIIAIHDRAPESGLPAQPNQLDRSFEYDAIYRLIFADGRECDTPPPATPWEDNPKCQDVTRTRRYTETYRYDRVGNMLQLRRAAGTGSFTRGFAIQPENNQLATLTIGNGTKQSFDYQYDVNGNMIGEGSSRHFEWDHSDQMKAFRTQAGNSEPSLHAHYLYNAGGQRVKKLVRRQNGGFESTTYIDGIFEHHQWGDSPNEQNNHLHIMDDQTRVALVRVGSAHPQDRGPAIQYHLSDHLGSSNIVINADGSFINREEHTPYGETSFGSFARKRYRFTGKERDEESGLNYHGARYYAPWLVRWVSTDPLSLDGSRILYGYGDNEPVAFIDPTGEQPEGTKSSKQDERIGNRKEAEVKLIQETLERADEFAAKAIQHAYAKIGKSDSPSDFRQKYENLLQQDVTLKELHDKTTDLYRRAIEMTAKEYNINIQDQSIHYDYLELSPYADEGVTTYGSTTLHHTSRFIYTNRKTGDVDRSVNQVEKFAVTLVHETTHAQRQKAGKAPGAVSRSKLPEEQAKYAREEILARSKELEFAKKHGFTGNLLKEINKGIERWKKAEKAAEFRQLNQPFR